MAIDIYQKVRGTALWPLFTVSQVYYVVNEALRKYHNHTHAFNVVTEVNVLTDNDPSIALLLAAEWHDAVYFPNAGSDANERCSSAALGIEARNLAQSVELSKEIKDAVNRAQDLIEYTSVNQHLYYDCIGGDLGILLDADLSSLAAPYDKFVDNQHYIIMENGGVITVKNCKKSAEFLRQFLYCRKSIYHTDLARKLWEAKAEANITRWCDMNGVAVNDEIDDGN